MTAVNRTSRIPYNIGKIVYLFWDLAQRDPNFLNNFKKLSQLAATDLANYISQPAFRNDLLTHQNMYTTLKNWISTETNELLTLPITDFDANGNLISTSPYPAPDPAPHPAPHPVILPTPYPVIHPAPHPAPYPVIHPAPHPAPHPALVPAIKKGGRKSTKKTRRTQRKHRK